jgi:phosphate transport system permease protein
MNAAAAKIKTSPPAEIILAPPVKTADGFFKFLTWLMAMLVLALVVLVGWTLYRGSRPALAKFGWSFFVHANWDPVTEDFGALPFIFGTFACSFLALIIALPLSLGTAVFLTELAPQRIRQTTITLIEMLAAIPSVVYGIWGAAVLIPWLMQGPYPFLKRTLPFLPFFQGPIYGVCILSASLVLAIMIVPIITSISREVLRSVPDSQREAAFALGATRWEVTKLAVLGYSVRGLFGAAMLGLGRALGEAMAVTLLIGNVPQITKSLFAPGYTLASGIVMEFAEANPGMHVSALFELGLVLLLVTLTTNVLAYLLIGALGSRKPSAH